jgi:Bacterial capsule synthesis protein PGA_cap
LALGRRAVLAAGLAPLSLVWGGDVTLGSRYGHPPQRGWPELAPVARALRGADVAAVNYEGTFGSGGPSKCAGGLPNCFAFQAPAANAGTLRRAGVDLVNQANNHAHDFGAPGMAMTHAALRAAGVGWTGAPGRIRVLRRRGVRIAFTGFSTYPWSASMADDAAVRALIRRAARRAPVVVALFHAGAEGADRTHVPRGAEHAFGEYRGRSRHFAHVAIDAGADLVLGSGPHVLRGLQLYRRRLVAYSLGNLAGWRNFGTAGTTGISALLRVRLAPDGRLLHGTVRSLRLDRVGVPHPDPSHAALRLMRSVSAADFGASSAFAGTVGSTAGTRVR